MSSPPASDINIVEMIIIPQLQQIHEMHSLQKATSVLLDLLITQEKDSLDDLHNCLFIIQWWTVVWESRGRQMRPHHQISRRQEFTFQSESIRQTEQTSSFSDTLKASAIILLKIHVHVWEVCYILWEFLMCCFLRTVSSLHSS